MEVNADTCAVAGKMLEKYFYSSYITYVYI